MKLFSILFALVLGTSLSAQNFDSYTVRADMVPQSLVPCIPNLDVSYNWDGNNYTNSLHIGGLVDLPESQFFTFPTVSGLNINGYGLNYDAGSGQWNTNGGNSMIICCGCEAYRIDYIIDTLSKDIWIILTRDYDLGCTGPGCDNNQD